MKQDSCFCVYVCMFLCVTLSVQCVFVCVCGFVWTDVCTRHLIECVCESVCVYVCVCVSVGWVLVVLWAHCTECYPRLGHLPSKDIQIDKRFNAAVKNSVRK